jgi:hypothetical protein
MLEVTALLRGQMKEKIAVIETHEMFQPGSNVNLQDTEGLK